MTSAVCAGVGPEGERRAENQHLRNRLPDMLDDGISRIRAEPARRLHCWSRTPGAPGMSSVIKKGRGVEEVDGTRGARAGGGGCGDSGTSPFAGQASAPENTARTAKGTVDLAIHAINNEDAVGFGALFCTPLEIDLSVANADKLRDDLAGFIAATRRTGGRLKRGAASPSSASPARPADREKTKAIREWARENGFDLAERGRIPGSVIAAYEEALAEAAKPKGRGRKKTKN